MPDLTKMQAEIFYNSPVKAIGNNRKTILINIRNNGSLIHRFMYSL
ncbi:MAG TPA: hypothetical protein VKZ53_07315 [Candidatus Angelobacter sp.]|nr:hypothetical protein [Candidatus Angelobacter sp.]